MIFRQIFDLESSTYTYILADSNSKDALIIDSVIGKTEQYIKLIKELDLKLKYIIDTHVHADHITASGKLKQQTNALIVLGEQTNCIMADHKIKDGEILKIGNIELLAIYTPGHTDDSYSFYTQNMLFTGDTLFIRGTGRTDFQNGSAADAYNSIFNKLLVYPDDTLIYPGHDYSGNTVSTIYEEKKFNPRLQVKNCNEYENIMNNLNLSKPKLIDIAIPANLRCGL